MQSNEARSLATGLLERFRIASPPVPVERIARGLGAELRFVPYEGNISGMLFHDEGTVIIGVNALHPRTRQRFTIAHELGHLLLKTGRNQVHLDKYFPIRMRD